MGRAAGVVAWEDGGELRDAVVLGGLEAAEEGGVEVGGVGDVAVAGGDDAGVDAGGVAVWKGGLDCGRWCGGRGDVRQKSIMLFTTGSQVAMSMTWRSMIISTPSWSSIRLRRMYSPLA